MAADATPALATVPTSHIFVGDRLRKASDAQVAALVASIRDVGLLNPITVYPRDVLVGNTMTKGYGLIAGMHRLTACKALGMDSVPAYVVTLSDLERQIAECDENLCGPKLTASEQAMFSRRRKEAYEALHPETRAAAFKGNRHTGSLAVDKLSTASFAEDQAAKTGVDARTVRRMAERGEKIDDEVLEMIRGTHLDSGAFLDSIKAKNRASQIATVQHELENAKRRRTRAQVSPRTEEASEPGPANRDILDTLAQEVEALKAKVKKLEETLAEKEAQRAAQEARAAIAAKQARDAETRAMFAEADKERLQAEVVALARELERLRPIDIGDETFDIPLHLTGNARPIPA